MLTVNIDLTLEKLMGFRLILSVRLWLWEGLEHLDSRAAAAAQDLPLVK